MSWEDILNEWAKPPADSEQERCENAEKMIRNAIAASYKLNKRNIKVFTQGSYKNRTNVKKESDVDVGILCYDSFFPDYQEIPAEHFGHENSKYSYLTFKNEVGEALVSYFGFNSVERGNKAFDIKENSYHVEADVAPFFEHRRYSEDGNYLSGVELRPDNNIPIKVINWPEQHYKNGVNKNDNTNKRFKSLVRIVKKLRYSMEDEGILDKDTIPGFLIECLVWNIPNKYFSYYTYTQDLRDGLSFLLINTIKDEDCSEWGEVSELKYLFRGKQKWTSELAHTFISKAWDYMNF